jgi:hypothetical protein
MAEESTVTPLPATQLRYRYVSVHRVVGFSELRTGADSAVVRELPLSLGVAGISASLSVDPNPALAEVDRGTAIGYLMLRELVGQGAAGNVIESIRATVEEIGQERMKPHGAAGVYLVIEARGELTSTPTAVARDSSIAVRRSWPPRSPQCHSPSTRSQM